MAASLDDPTNPLRVKARAMITAGDLPGVRVPISSRVDSNHKDLCRVCGQVISPDERIWFQLDFFSKGRPDLARRGPIKPELHENCYLAWSIDARD